MVDIDWVGIDHDDPPQRLAAALVDADDRLLREPVERCGEAGLTQAQVGERMGVSQPAMARFERADSGPRLSTLRRYDPPGRRGCRRVRG